MAVTAGTRAGRMPGRFALLGDERLARLAGAGHARAFAVVYERHHQALYRYCRSILRHDADAQDALQSTFAAAFAALSRGQRDAPIRPWLFRIAHNEAVSLLRRRRPTAELSALDGACSASVEEQVAERDELSLLLHDLAKLTERQRAALVMRELSGLSHEEIAIALGTSAGAAKQTIYEARRSLFEFAEGRAMACDDIRRAISDADGRALRSRRVRAHLLACAPCSAFAAAIPARGADLRALAPAVPTVAAAGLLEHAVGAGSAHGAGAVGASTAAAGKVAGVTLTANAMAGVAVVASATVGVTIGIGRIVHTDHRPAVKRTVAPAVAPASSRTAPVVGAALGGRLLAPAGSPRSVPRASVHRLGAAGSTSATAGHRPAPGRARRRPARAFAGGAGGATSTTGPASVQPGPDQAKVPPGETNAPPGQAKKTQSGQTTQIPPGQAKKTQSGQTTQIPPGQAKKTQSGQPLSVPPGQAKKTQSGQTTQTRPGRAKKSEPSLPAAAVAPPAAAPGRGSSKPKKSN